MKVEHLNACDRDAFVKALEGIYEETDWMSEEAFTRLPFRDVAELKAALRQCVDARSFDERLALVRAHPELAGEKAAALSLSHESTQEQRGAGLLLIDGEPLERLRALNAAYREKFGFPFVVAVRGANGRGLALDTIVDILQQRLGFTQEVALAESLEQIHLIAALRLDSRFQ